MKKIQLIIVIILLCFNFSFGQKSTARFLLYQPSARSSAMAGAGSIIHNDAFGTYYNPATLPFAPKINIVGSFQKPIPYFGNIAHSYIAASYKLDSINTIAASANLYWPGAQVWSDATAWELGGIKSELNWQGRISYANKIKENISVGVSLAYLTQNLVPDNVNVGAESRESVGNAFMVDFGVVVKNIYENSTTHINDSKNQSGNKSKNSGISIGLAARNLGPDVTQINKDQGDPLPGQFIIGILWSAFQSQKMDIDFVLDIEKQIAESSSADYVRFGSEINILNYFYLRGGYALDTFGIKNSFATVGVGVKYKFVSIDIAYFDNTFDPIYHYSGSLFLEKGILK
jgi:type IX secretion system protein PorV